VAADPGFRISFEGASRIRAGVSGCGSAISVSSIRIAAVIRNQKVSNLEWLCRRAGMLARIREVLSNEIRDTVYIYT